MALWRYVVKKAAGGMVAVLERTVRRLWPQCRVGQRAAAVAVLIRMAVASVVGCVWMFYLALLM
jgi:hypothetical protein